MNGSGNLSGFKFFCDPVFESNQIFRSQSAVFSYPSAFKARQHAP
jgi:hypothetical protein